MTNILKKLKQRKLNDKIVNSSNPRLSWIDEEGMHYIGTGINPTADDYKRMTEDYQQNIRKSPFWKMMVRQFGKKKAEEMLKEFQVKPG